MILLANLGDDKETPLLDEEGDTNFTAIVSPLRPPIGFWRPKNFSVLGFSIESLSPVWPLSH